jgi:hypothetical protein
VVGGPESTPPLLLPPLELPPPLLLPPPLELPPPLLLPPPLELPPLPPPLELPPLPPPLLLPEPSPVAGVELLHATQTIVEAMKPTVPNRKDTDARDAMNASG